ncbi:MAG: replicative DNA helicase, partial [Cetobacterium sp.]|nr:replicative DNA helicase [Cetobacterium sp.]
MEDIQTLRKVPSSIEAERSVLGGIFLKPDVFGEVIEVISPNDFYKTQHKIIYETMMEIYGAGNQIDPIIVMDRLKRKNKFEEIGGETILYEIIEEVTTAAN